jgi:large subunit ribosomal protein L4
LAFRRAFSDLVREERIRILDQLSFAEPKTKVASSLLKSLGLSKGALFVVDTLDKNLVCAIRNLTNVEATTAKDVSTFQLLRYPVTVVTKAGMDGLRARLEGEAGRNS